MKTKTKESGLKSLDRLTASEIMNDHVVCIPLGTSVEKVVRILDEEEIHGMPVVDAANAPVGVVSRTDVTRALAEDFEEEELPPLQREMVPDADNEEQELEPTKTTRARLEMAVEEIMSDRLVAAKEDTTVPELARLMLEHGVHRILITRSGRLVGIVSSTDLLGSIAAAPGRR